jgi:uncharacterized protein YdeI (YjbR/CyaY-like superfamily)
MNPKVNAYLREEQRWREESTKLRAICLGCGLTEELKWGKPCYTGARQIRFTDARQVVAMTPVIRAYIKEAVAAEKAGLKVEYKKTPEPTPQELQYKLDHYPAFKAAFGALTPGRQRAYILYFSAAKQSKTSE